MHGSLTSGDWRSKYQHDWFSLSNSINNIINIQRTCAWRKLIYFNPLLVWKKSSFCRDSLQRKAHHPEPLQFPVLGRNNEWWDAVCAWIWLRPGKSSINLKIDIHIDRIPTDSRPKDSPVRIDILPHLCHDFSISLDGPNLLSLIQQILSAANGANFLGDPTT